MREEKNEGKMQEKECGRKEKNEGEGKYEREEGAK